MGWKLIHFCKFLSKNYRETAEWNLRLLDCGVQPLGRESSRYFPDYDVGLFRCVAWLAEFQGERKHGAAAARRCADTPMQLLLAALNKHESACDQIERAGSLQAVSLRERREHGDWIGPDVRPSLPSSVFYQAGRGEVRENVSSRPYDGMCRCCCFNCRFCPIMPPVPRLKLINLR